MCVWGGHGGGGGKGTSSPCKQIVQYFALHRAPIEKPGSSAFNNPAVNNAPLSAERKAVLKR